MRKELLRTFSKQEHGCMVELTFAYQCEVLQDTLWLFDLGLRKSLLRQRCERCYSRLRNSL